MMYETPKLKGLPQQLFSHLFNNGDWVPKGDITAMEWRHKSGKSIGARYLPETVGRALRHLEEQHLIAVKPCGISVQYKYMPIDHRRLRERYIPTSERPLGQQDKLFKD